MQDAYAQFRYFGALMEIIATVREIRFRNDSNGWTVINCTDDDGNNFAAVGIMPSVNAAEQVQLVGKWVEHPMYGKQLRVDNYKNILPKERKALIAYLSSGFIKGVGETLARQIVDKFGDETFDIIRDDMDKLTLINGIGKKKAKMIHDSYIEKYYLQDIVIGMQELGLSVTMAMKLYKLYGPDCVKKVRENPYKLIDDVDNIGFRTADSIAREAGYEPESDFRIKAGIKYTLSLARQEGNTCLPRDTLLGVASMNVLGIERDSVEAVLEKMILTSEVREIQLDEAPHIYLPYMYMYESECAVKLIGLIRSVGELPLFNIDDAIEKLEAKLKLRLAPLQSEAVKRSCTDGVIVVTGGPGTGKTTILSFIINIMEAMGLEISLAAPTGRAAKRMTDATGREAKTLHRLLEYSFSNNEFNRNSDYPLDADVIIVDEMSMVDVTLFNALLRAIPEGTRLVMVGDVDQLPSVGPGNVLRDIVHSETVPVIKLDRIYRQAGRSMIITNAHLINHGEMPILTPTESDFRFYECGSTDIALRSVLDLCYDYTCQGHGGDIQVLAPMKNDKLGVYNLNSRLQNMLNPANDDKAECRFGDTLFREGDRVMQNKNDYDIIWTRKVYGKPDEEGEGIFNGDIGTIMHIDNISKYVTVLFDDERSADYNFPQLEEIELAYCISIHKSQGSEFPCVVLVLMNGPMMLMTRNILYTAVTRARSNLFIIGSSGCIERMVGNTREKRRYSGLLHFLTELGTEIS